jgi:hypothetical protein
MDTEVKQPNPISLARQILKFRKEKHPYGYNYAVRVRLGHAEIQDLTAIAEILSAVEELGYEIVKKTSEAKDSLQPSAISPKTQKS